MGLKIWINPEFLAQAEEKETKKEAKQKPKKASKKETKKQQAILYEDVEEADVLEERVLLNEFAKEERAIVASFIEQARSITPKRNGLVYIAENMRYIKGFIAKKAPSRFRMVRRNYIDGRNSIEPSRIDQEDLFQELCEWFIKKPVAENKAKQKVLNRVNNVIRDQNREFAKFASKSLELLREEMGDHYYPEFVLDRNLAYKDAEDDSAQRVRDFIDVLPEPLNKIASLLYAGYSQREIASKLGMGLDKVSKSISSIQNIAVRGNVLDKGTVLKYAPLEAFIVKEEAV